MRARLPLLCVLGLSLALNASGIWWGLPSVQGWAPDELIPAEVLAGTRAAFSRGWHNAYPPFHFYLLAAAYAPFLLEGDGMADVSQEGWRRQEAGSTYLALFLAGRALSLVMALATVLLVYRAAREVLDRTAAVFAALIASLVLPFVFYAKLANVDLPYTLWFALSLLAYLRILRGHELKDYLWFSAASVLSVCTKDQAYALYPLPAAHVLVSLHRHRRAQGKAASLPALLLDGRIVSSCLVALVLFIAAQNLAFNLRGFVDHVRVVTGPLNRDLQMFERNPEGQWAMLRLTAGLVAFSLGAPAAVACLAGVVLALLRRPRNHRLLAALLPGVSYYVFFLSVALVAYDRFMMPLCLILSLFGGQALSELSRSRLPAVVRLSAAAALGFGLVRCLALDLFMLNDSRYRAEEWMSGNVEPGARLAAVGPLAYLPRLQGFDWMHAPPTLEGLERLQPDYVVLNSDFTRRPEDEASSEFHSRLSDGASGYRLAFSHRSSLPWPFDLRPYLRGKEGHSNLQKVNPEISVFRRVRR